MKHITLKLMLFLLLLCVGYLAFYYFSIRNVKGPTYRVESSKGNIEIRQYNPILVAEVVVEGTRAQAIHDGFKMLFDYIFGNNVSHHQHKKISMTVPVLQSPYDHATKESSSKKWKIQFIMPEEYTLHTVPKPINGLIKFFELPQKRMIAIRFSGRMTDMNLYAHKLMLDEYIKNNHIEIKGAPYYAFYNPPWTLPFLSRYEIIYALK